MIDDDVVFDVNATSHLSNSVSEIKNVDWQLLYLGADCQDKVYSLVSGCEQLREVGTDKIGGGISSHAVAYSESIYAKILTELPTSIDEMKNYLETNLPTIDQCLSVDSTLKRVMVDPVVVR